MLAALARLAVARRRLILVATALFLAVTGGVGGGVASQLSGGGFDDPAAESVLAAEVLEEQFASGAPNLVLLARAPEGVDDPAAVAAGEQLAPAWPLSPASPRSCPGGPRAVPTRSAPVTGAARWSLPG